MAFPLVSVTGFVVGAVVVIALIAVLVLLVTKRQWAEKNDKEDE